MGIRETSPFLRQPINIRRLQFRCAITPQVAVTEIIGVDEDDIWFARGPGGRRGEVGTQCRTKTVYNSVVLMMVSLSQEAWVLRGT